jgi:SnoaL-like domain
VNEGSASYVEILNLVHSYPELIDSGDFAGVGELFRDATLVFEGPDGSAANEASGSAAVRAVFERSVRLYPDDGTPHTRHVISNPIVEIDEPAGHATCRYYITVFQRTDEFPLQPVWANRYEDTLRRDDGKWRLEHRRGFAHLVGDTSRHLVSPPPM